MKNLIILLFLFLGIAGPSLAADQLIVVALPFYAQSTGWGLGIKGLHPNIGNNVDIDFASYATTKSRYGLFATIGQRSIPAIPVLFWNFKVNWSKQKRDYYGEGNDLPLSTDASYKYDSIGHSQRLGLNLGSWAKIYGLHLYSREKTTQFNDPMNQFPDFWESEVPAKSYSFMAWGGGIELGRYDSNTRPTQGNKVVYEFYDSYRGNINIQHHMLSMAHLMPLMPRWSHGIHLYFESFAGDVPFAKYKPIWVRGVEGQRHNGLSSLALHNESRIFLGNDFILTPFYDLGRVYIDSDQRYSEKIHQGYGLGFRYVFRDALVFRLDFGFSSGGELDFLFNYQHTF